MKYQNGKYYPEFGAQKELISEQDLRDYGIHIGKLIMGWDTKNIKELIVFFEEHDDIIKALASLHTDLDAFGVDMSDLPSADYPIWMNTIDFWAVDKNGMCLVGPFASIIEHFSVFVNGVRFSELDENLRTNILSDITYSILYDTIIDRNKMRFPDMNIILSQCSPEELK